MKKVALTSNVAIKKKNQKNWWNWSVWEDSRSTPRSCCTEHLTLSRDLAIPEKPPKRLRFLEAFLAVIVEVAILEKAREHVVCVQRLILRGFVAGSLEGGECELIVDFNISRRPSIDVPRLPLVGNFSGELAEALLGICKWNSRDVHVTGIDQDIQRGLVREDLLVIWDHRVSILSVVESVAADAPGGRFGADCLLDDGFIQIVDELVSIRRAFSGIVDG